MSVNHDWLDAKGFVAWFEERVSPDDLTRLRRDNPKWGRAIVRWRSETELVNIYTADEFLCALDTDIHLWEVPDDLYRDRTYVGGATTIESLGRSTWKIPDEQRELIRQAEGTHVEVAKAFGISSRTVYYIRKGKTSRGKVPA